MYIKRAIEDTVIKVSAMFPVLLVTGPRQVGKTTMLQNLSTPDRKYVTLDDPDVRYLAKHDPALFMQRYTPPVLIDEIQYAPELLPYLPLKSRNQLLPIRQQSKISMYWPPYRNQNNLEGWMI